MEFLNPQIEVKNLPKVENLVFQPLEPGYFKVLILSKIVYLLILTSAIGVFLIVDPLDLSDLMQQALLLFFLFYVIWSFVGTVKGFKHKEYALRSRDVVYKSGWLWKSTTTAPFNRVQHVRIDQGLIERQFDLAKLKIFTAGGSSSDLTIPGLNPITANALKEYIVKKTINGEEE